MVADKLMKGMPARILLETTVMQEGEVFKHSFDEMGRIVRMNENYYLRFTESGDDGVANLIKIAPEGVVQITRHTENKTILEFDEDNHTFTNYATPAGILRMRVETTRMSTSYSQKPFAGEIEVDYEIYMEDDQIGTYQVRLRFTT